MAILAGVAGLLIYAGYSDFRRLLIPNWISVLMAVAFVLVAPTLGLPEIMSRVTLAGLVFVVGFVFFALNILGAGDVKLLAAILLFVPAGQSAVFFLILSVTLLIGVAIVVSLRSAFAAQLSGCKSMVTPGAFPMGISIASAGLISLWV